MELNFGIYSRGNTDIIDNIISYSQNRYSWQCGIKVKMAII